MKSLPILSLCAALLAPGAVWAAKAHQHGVMTLDVALDGPTLTLQLEAPLDNLVGFERAPRNDAERKAVADALARLRDGAALFKPDAAARCALSAVDVRDDAFQPPPAGQKAAEHADLEAEYRFTCEQPQALRAVDIGLFDAFRRTSRIEVQVAGPKGQSKTTLRRPARSLPLVR